jgi:hypothetical protein
MRRIQGIKNLIAYLVSVNYTMTEEEINDLILIKDIPHSRPISSIIIFDLDHKDKLVNLFAVHLFFLFFGSANNRQAKISLHLAVFFFQFRNDTLFIGCIAFKWLVCHKINHNIQVEFQRSGQSFKTRNPIFPLILFRSLPKRFPSHLLASISLFSPML